MGDYISDLPRDILCYILSFLTVRDASKVRSLSSRWKDLSDYRSVLKFDAFSILGEDVSHGLESKFVKAVNDLAKKLGTHNINALKIKYKLGNEYASHIDAWVSSVSSKGVEELDLDFVYREMENAGGYVLPCHLLHTEKGSNLKCLRLKYIHLTLTRNACSSWLSKLSTIELTCVPISLSDLECILSNSPNLESLCLIKCKRRRQPVRIQHPSLKKLVIEENYYQFELCCPRLEIFDFCGRADFTFSHAPLLRKASLKLLDTSGILFYKYKNYSSVFSNLGRNAPELQSLLYHMTCEVSVSPSITMSGLKRLELVADIPTSFDLCAITDLLHASPVLEALYLKLRYGYSRLRNVFLEIPQKQYVDRLHFHLKVVKIEEPFLRFCPKELLEYLLRNGVSLQQMILVVGSSDFKNRPKFTMLQNMNPAVELIVT